jgi:hypothetical protein
VADFGFGELSNVLPARADVHLKPAWLAFFTLGRSAAHTCPRRAPRFWGSVISLALLCASKRRYAARIFACARSNTANPESLPEIPSAQPLAWLMMRAALNIISCITVLMRRRSALFLSGLSLACRYLFSPLSQQSAL